MSYKIFVNDKYVYFNFDAVNFSSKPLDKRINKELYTHGMSNRLSKLYVLVTNSCNLSCKYCFAHGGTYENNNGKQNIDMDTFKNTFLKLQEVYSEGIDIIQFFGGEPLLNCDFIIECIEYVNQYCKENELKIPRYSIVTNGILLQDVYYNLLKNYNVFITISLDGQIRVNDRNRVYSNGSGSFKKICENIKLIGDNNQLTVEFSISDALIEQYYDEMANDTIKEFKEMGFETIITNIIYSDDCIRVYHENYEVYKKFIKDYISLLIGELFDEKCKLYDILLTNLIISILSQSDVRNTCSCGVNNLTMNTEGELLTCSLSNHILYDFREESISLKEIRKLYCNVIPPESCQRCSCQKICSSWCRELDNQETMPYKCFMIKSMVEEFLKILYKEKCNKRTMGILVHNIEKFTDRMG